MIPRLKKREASHKGAQPTPKPVAAPGRFPAPLRGLVLNEGLADPQPGGASVLDNWICGLTSIKPRQGYAQHARVSTTYVRSMFVYSAGGIEKLFATSDGKIVEISSPADPDVVPTADVAGQADTFYSTEQFGTAGGNYLYAVNGVDSARLYDGSTWSLVTGATSPAITGIATAALSHVWSYSNRLFFVEKDTASAWYLPVDSIGGAAAQFSLAGIFKAGGALLFGATWSLDSGDGPSEQCVFVSTEGEVAVYRGTDPGNASAWAKVGVYQLARPLGAQAIMKAGGDLLVATEVGLVPLSQAIRKDAAALALGAVSARIEPLWQAQANNLRSTPWQIAKWSAENIMIVSQPEAAVSLRTCLVANLQTGAWSRFTGVDMQSVTVFQGRAYFGASNGKIYEMQTSGADAGANYTAVYLGLFEGLGASGRQKTVLQARPTFVSNTPIDPKITMNVDYDSTIGTAPGAVAFDAAQGWGASVWDTSLWDAGTGQELGAEDSRWQEIAATGYAHAMQMQLTFGSTTAPNIEYVGADYTHRVGALVA